MNWQTKLPRGTICGLKATCRTTIGVVIAAGIFAFLPAARAQLVDRVVASVNGQPITTHDIKAFSLSNGLALPAPNDPQYSQAIKSVLKGLIEQKMLEEESKKYADKVSASQVDAYIQNLEQQNHLTNQQFRDQLAASGITYDEFRQRVRMNIERMMMLQTEVRSKINIPDSEVEAYFKAHPDEFKVKQERFKLAQILIAVPSNAPPAQVAAAKAKAEKVREQAVKGADFAQLAEKYSDDTSKTKGGELGFFTPDEILPQIDTAIAHLKAGQISKVVRTQYGFHILKVEEHQMPGVDKLTPTIANQIRNKLMTEQAKARFQSWVENDLAKEYHIEAFY